MSIGEIFSFKQPRKNRTLKRGDVLGREEKSRKKSPVRRVVVGSLVACLLVALIIGGRSALQVVNTWTQIQQLTILGLDRLTRKEITSTLALSSQASLWSIDTEELGHRVEKHPWIRTVTFDRAFPHSLVVQIEERKPAAVLRASKQSYVLDSEGYLLPGETTTAAQSLPVLEGLTSNDFSQQEDEGHRRARQGIHLAALLSERFSGRPIVNVAQTHTTIVDLPRIRVHFGQEPDRQWERFLVLYPTIKQTIERQSQEVDLRFSQKVILRKRTL